MKKLITTDNLNILTLAEVPQRSETYTPISNTYLHGIVIEESTKEGLALIDYQFKASTNGEIMIGTYRFESKYPDLNMMIGWRNSYDKSRTAVMCSGSKVHICENGFVFSDEQFVRKHTSNVDEMILPILLAQIKLVQTNMYQSADFAHNLKQVIESPEYIYGMLGNLYMDEVLSSTQLSKVKEEYHGEHSFNYNVEINNLYNIYNLCTLSLKSEHPSTYFNKHQRLQVFFQEQLAFLNIN